MPASVRTGPSTGGIGSGTLNGSGSFALLCSSVPVEPSPEHPDAPKERASIAPPARLSLKNSLREISICRSSFLSQAGPRLPGDEETCKQDQESVHRV